MLLFPAGKSPSVPGGYQLYLYLEQATLTPHTASVVAQLVAGMCGVTGQWYRGLGQDLTDCSYLGLTVPSLSLQLVMMVTSRQGRLLYLGVAEQGGVAGYQVPLVRCRGEGGPVASRLVGRGGQVERGGGGGVLVVYLLFLVGCMIM